MSLKNLKLSCFTKALPGWGYTYLLLCLYYHRLIRTQVWSSKTLFTFCTRQTFTFGSDHKTFPNVKARPSCWSNSQVTTLYRLAWKVRGQEVMGLQLLCACFLLWPSISCCLCNCSMGCLFWVSPGCVGSSVVGQAESQATWVLVLVQPGPNPLSDTLPNPLCPFFCLGTVDLFCSDVQPFRLSLLVYAQKSLSDYVCSRKTAHYFFAPR